MIFLDVQFEDFTPALFAEASDAVFDMLLQPPFQNSEPVFWDPNQVIFAVPDGM
jgi:hypothetical protein